MSRLCIVALTIVLLPALALAQGEEVQPLPNASFEDGLAGWSQWPDESDSTIHADTQLAADGNTSLRVDAISPSDRAFVLQSSSDFEPGSVYRVSVAIRKDPGIPDNAVGFVVNYRGGGTGAILSRAQPMSLTKEPLEDGWVRWSGLFFDETEGVESWQILMRVEYAVGSVWFDDIRFERLGPPSDLTPDVWTYIPIGVEIGGPPASRFARHREADDEAYQAAVRYNELLMKEALAEADLREVERCHAYAGREAPADLRERFEAMESALNEGYLSFAASFKSGDWAQFEPVAARIDEATEALTDAIAAARVEILPRNAIQLPEQLGEQPRTLPPFADGGTRMNRLLIGEWSPTGWRDFERPFDFEFHSASRSGLPQDWPEGGEPDFGNITAKCDELQSWGFAGTFSMMPFGQHDVIWAPDWFMAQHADDPDVRKVSWDGRQGRDSSSYYGLNYYHPAVREFMRDYLTKFASFAKDEPRVFFYETAQEAYPYFSAEGARRQTGYGPSAQAEFHRFLAGNYQTIAALNEAWGTDYAAFDAIEPPPDRFAKTDREITPLVAEFERFIENGYIDYLKLVYGSIKAGDPDKPVASRHSALLTAINGARIFETCDVLGYHRGDPDMQVMNLYLNTLSRYNERKPLAYLEDFWGMQDESDRITQERVQRRGLEKHVSRTFAWGRTLQMKWYAYTTGSYIFTYNGNWFDPRYDVLTMRYCAPALKVALDGARKVDWLLTHSQIPQFRAAIWQPSASMRTQARYGLSSSEIISLHGLIYPAGFAYELVPEEYFADGRADLADFDAVFLPCAEYLSEEHQRRLIDYVRGGGTLVAIEPPGVRDELTRPSGLLLRELYGIDDVAFDAEAAWWTWQSTRCTPGPMEMAEAGEGRAYITATTLMRALGEEADSDALLAMLGERVLRDAWARDAGFEVLTRITDDGERYLFALNPSADESRTDRVMLSGEVASATDVSVEGGFPVPVIRDGVHPAIDLTLGAGEMAVVWLR